MTNKSLLSIKYLYLLDKMIWFANKIIFFFRVYRLVIHSCQYGATVKIGRFGWWGVHNCSCDSIRIGSVFIIIVMVPTHDSWRSSSWTSISYFWMLNHRIRISESKVWFSDFEFWKMVKPTSGHSLARSSLFVLNFSPEIWCSKTSINHRRALNIFKHCTGYVLLFSTSKNVSTYRNRKILFIHFI